MEFLLWIFGLYLLFAVVLPAWLRWRVRRHMQRFAQAAGQQTKRPQREGKVTVHTTAETKHVRDDVGEYVEFEEITTQTETEC